MAAHAHTAYDSVACLKDLRTTPVGHNNEMKRHKSRPVFAPDSDLDPSRGHLVPAGAASTLTAPASISSSASATGLISIGKPAEIIADSQRAGVQDDGRFALIANLVGNYDGGISDVFFRWCEPCTGVDGARNTSASYKKADWVPVVSGVSTAGLDLGAAYHQWTASHLHGLSTSTLEAKCKERWRPGPTQTARNQIAHRKAVHSFVVSLSRPPHNIGADRILGELRSRYTFAARSIDTRNFAEQLARAEQTAKKGGDGVDAMRGEIVTALRASPRRKRSCAARLSL
jgi:hypothetical protein